ERPIRRLERVLARALGEPSRADEIEQRLHAGPEGLVALAEELCERGADDTHSVLLVVDQAEELATLTDDEDRTAFLNLLHGALIDESPLWAIATVRSEFLDAVLAGAGLAAAFNEPQLLAPLDRT